MQNSTQISIQEGGSSSDVNIQNTLYHFKKEPAGPAPTSGPSLTIFFGETRLEFVPQSHIPMDALCGVRRMGGGEKRVGQARTRKPGNFSSRCYRQLISSYNNEEKKNSMCVDEEARRAPS
jgi:hypothetical protein